MTLSLSKFLLRHFSKLAKGKISAGFTMIELLVSILISGIIVTGLLALVVELLGSDQRENSLIETEQEMQMAMDFISSEMRESVYVYDGKCLAGDAKRPECSGIFKSLATYNLPDPANSVPIIAYWKLDSLPDPTRAQCTSNPDYAEASYPSDGLGIPCLAGRTYTLVVYYLTKNQPGETWEGSARIQRFEFPKFSKSGTSHQRVRYYVDPTLPETNFASWPIDSVTKTNLQSSAGDVNPPSASVLVDFVDGSVQYTVKPCPLNYRMTPDDATLDAKGFSKVRSFYACVRVPIEDEEEGGSNILNQKVVLFLRGNAYGKPGIREMQSGSLPVLQTEVLNRGILNKNPAPF